MTGLIEPDAGRRSAPSNWQSELGKTLSLAWPLIIAQISSSLLFATDTAMMGWLGPEELAAGTLAASVLQPLVVGGMGCVGATAPLIAQALGARQGRSVRRTVRQGFWASVILSALIMPVLWHVAGILSFLGQPDEVLGLAEAYMHFAVYSVPPFLLIVGLRALLQAKGNADVVLWVTVGGVVANAFANYGLMFGNLGLPEFGLAGAGIATSLVNWVMFLTTLAFVVFHKRYKRYYVLVRLWKPDWSRFVTLFRIGIPAGLMLVSEVGMFAMAAIMMGWLGTADVAAHAVAMQLTAVIFMIPLGLSQAATIRVGHATGANDPEAVGRAGWTAFYLGLAVMALAAMAYLFLPTLLISVFVDPALPENAVTVSYARAFLMVAAFYSLLDGTQCIMAASLRGMSDTRVPLISALLAYWIGGMGSAYVLGFVLDLGGVGIWSGLAVGLGIAAVTLTARFMLRDRLNLVGRANSMRNG